MLKSYDKGLLGNRDCFSLHLRLARERLENGGTGDFSLFCYQPECLQKMQTITNPVKARVAAITGKTCSGKSYFVKQLCTNWPREFVQLPEVMTRQPRFDRGEIDGRDLIYMPKEEFDRRVRDGEFFLAFEFGSDGKRKGVGILIKTLERLCRDTRIKLLIADPYELAYFLPVFPATKCVLLRVGDREHQRFMLERGVEPVFGRRQNDTGVECDELSSLPHGTLCIWNVPSQTVTNITKISSFLRS